MYLNYLGLKIKKDQNELVFSEHIYRAFIKDCHLESKNVDIKR